MQNAAVRFLFPLSLFALVLPFSLAALGCDEAKLTTSPDDAGCAAPELEFPCKLQPAGTPGCPSDLDSGAALGRDLVLDGSAPANCTVIVNDLVPDEDNQCTTLGTCQFR